MSNNVMSKIATLEQTVINIFKNTETSISIYLINSKFRNFQRDRASFLSIFNVLPIGGFTKADLKNNMPATESPFYTFVRQESYNYKLCMPEIKAYMKAFPPSKSFSQALCPDTTN